MMRRILVDHARREGAAKRGGSMQRVTLDEEVSAGAEPDVELVALDDALQALAKLDPVLSQLVELRFFAGMTIEETAAVLDISSATVKREWTSARAWLYRRLNEGTGEAAT
jgi:RNA polymerase sigma factor (TIGR02999 family)